MNQFEASEAMEKPQIGLWRMTLALAVGIALFYLAFLKPGIWGLDGNDALQVSISLVTEGNFSVPPGEGFVQGPDGNYYSSRYALLPIVATPFVAVGLAIGNLLGLPARYVAAPCALLLNVLLTAGTASLVAMLAMRLGSTRRGAYLSAIAFAFGTTALVYSREFFAEPLLSILTIGGLYLGLGGTQRQTLGASVLSALAVSAKPAGIVLGPVIAGYLFFKKKSLVLAIQPLIGSAVGVMLHLGYNYLRFQSLVSGGQDSRFALEGTLERFLGLLISPGAGGGLLLYCPVVILSFLGFYKLFRKQPLEALAIAAIFAGYLVLHAFWAFSGWNWGPRFLVPTLPLLATLLAFLDRQQRVWIAALTLLGFIINSPTLIGFYQRFFAEAADKGCLTCSLSLWGYPWDSPIIQIWGITARQIGDAFSNNVVDVFRQSGTPPALGDAASADFFKILAVWWWMLPIARIPTLVGFLLALLLAGSGIGMLLRGWVGLKEYRNWKGHNEV